MRPESARTSGETAKAAERKTERGGMMETIRKRLGKISPALAFLAAMHSIGVRAEHGSKPVEREGDTIVAHFESAGGGDVETREVPPHTVALHTDVHFEWGERSFEHVGMERGESEAVEAQLQGLIDQEMAAYHAEGVNPSEAITHIRVDIEAFSDPTGGRANPERNQELSEGRAELASEVMRDILHHEGFDDAHIEITARGGGTEGDLMEFSGALSQMGFHSHAGSPESMRNEAERIVRAINDGNDSEVMRLTHGMSIEAVRQAYNEHVASHRHANVDLELETAGILVTHDAGNPPPVLEAAHSVKSQDTSRLEIKRPVYLNEERPEQPRFWQTSGQLREPEPPRDESESGQRTSSTRPGETTNEPRRGGRAGTTEGSVARPKEGAAARRGRESGSVESESDEPEVTIEELPRRERRALETMARQAERRGAMVVDSSQARVTEQTEGDDRARHERQTGSITLKVLRSVSYKPVKTGRYRGFAGSPGSLAG